MFNKKIPYDEFKNIFSKVPRLCVDLILKTDKGILLTKRTIGPFRRTWHFPGGGVLFDESQEQALKRIAKEELNLDINIIKMLGVVEYLNEVYGDFRRHSVGIVYLVKITSKSIELDNGAEHYSFFKNIPENMPSPQKEFLKKHLDIFQD